MRACVGALGRIREDTGMWTDGRWIVDSDLSDNASDMTSTADEEQPARPGEHSVTPRPLRQPHAHVLEKSVRESSGNSDATVVMPYVGSAFARRTRPLRAWMVTLPADLAALLSPLLLSTMYWRGLIFTAVLAVIFFATGGHYRGRRHISFLDELPSLLGRLLAAVAVAALIAAVRHDSVDYIDAFLRSVIVAAAVVVLLRAVTRKLVVSVRRKRWAEHGALILGNGPVAIELARLLRRYPQYGLRFAGLVSGMESGQVGGQPHLIGPLEELDNLIRTTETDVLIIADVEGPELWLQEVVSRPAAMNCDLWVVPRLHSFSSHSGIPDHIGAIPVTHVRRPTLTGPKWALKRTSDILFAAIGLLLVSPILLLCAIAVRIEGGRGILFRQERIGRYGRRFEVIKFRSMRPATKNESQTMWSVADDPRIGPVGRFLRRTSLDELPQLWNILRGDMPIVGPRPERPFFVEQFSVEHANYGMRHRVPVGLTGLAQVSGLRGDTPISDRARFDNYYIENWSLWLDVKVVLRTIAEVFRGGGR
jgi:exopolysaccharide biosynthesis polyprenyl glycosylphosphotransferase